MEEARDPKSAVNVTDTTDDATTHAGTGRDAEATNDETLRDLEESQKVSTTTSSTTDATSSSPDSPVAPSPDGAFDDTRGTHDGSEPM